MHSGLLQRVFWPTYKTVETAKSKNGKRSNLVKREIDGRIRRPNQMVAVPKVCKCREP